mmetsp:Transcript_17420/g.46439  ORF Transcript_17420/g.46439 Transcript_17420/m.46439 type:complete len:237 (-) Transcript_17420:1279-1989(-)
MGNFDLRHGLILFLLAAADLEHGSLDALAPADDLNSRPAGRPQGLQALAAPEAGLLGQHLNGAGNDTRLGHALLEHCLPFLHIRLVAEDLNTLNLADHRKPRRLAELGEPRLPTTCSAALALALPAAAVEPCDHLGFRLDQASGQVLDEGIDGIPCFVRVCLVTSCDPHRAPRRLVVVVFFEVDLDLRIGVRLDLLHSLALFANQGLRLILIDAHHWRRCWLRNNLVVLALLGDIC